MRLFIITAISIYSYFANADFSNSELTKMAADDWIAEKTIEDCIEADKYSSFGFIEGDTSDPATKVKIYYQHVIRDKSKPTLIYLPGGPGGTSIGEYEDFEKLSNMFNMLYIDPRGFGCNFMGENFTDYENLRSERVASDLVQIVNKEKLSNYYIFSVSFGTLLGTVSTYELEKNGTPPKALILEGILGNGFDNWAADYENQIAKNFNKYLRSNSWIINLLDRIDLLEKDSSWFFNQFVRRLFSDNGTVAPDDWTLEELEEIKKLSDKELLKFITDKLQSSSDQDGTDNSSVQSLMESAVSCNEISKKDINYDRLWDKKSKSVIVKKTPGASDICSNHGFSNKYDPVNFQLTSPVYYFQGSEDPATPLSSARYHYESQFNKGKNVFIEVQGAGHSPFYEVLEPCALSIWKAILKGQNLSSVLNSKGYCL